MYTRKKGQKYNNKKTEINGIKFDSKKESKRYIELKKLEEIGNITNLQLQPKFILQDSYKKYGKTIRAITYVADFQYTDSDGNIIVEDVKASPKMLTEVYKIKKKIFEYKFGNLNIKEVY